MSNKGIRRGIGEYEPAENNQVIDSKPSMVNLRRLFLYAIREHHRDVLVALSKEPLEAFAAASPAFNGSLRLDVESELLFLTGSFLTGSVVEIYDYERYTSEQRVLSKALSEWANTYNLRDEWCLREALHALELWHGNATMLEELQWRHNGDAYLRLLNPWQCKELSDKYWDSSKASVFGFEHYDPTHWYEDEYRTEIEKHFKQRLNAYIEEVTRIVLDAGFVKSHKKRFKEEHFEWLVKFQTKGMTQEDIAMEISNGNRAMAPVGRVAKGVQRLSDVISLTRRQ